MDSVLNIRNLNPEVKRYIKAEAARNDCTIPEMVALMAQLWESAQK